MNKMALPSTQYPKFHSRSNTQPLGHAADIVCYVFIFFMVNIKKIESKLFISKIQRCYQFSRLQNYTNRYIIHVFVFITSKFMV